MRTIWLPVTALGRLFLRSLNAKSALAALLLAGAMAPLSAATFYVATTGNDSNAGTIAAPFATLMRAQTAATGGDTIYVRGGTYTTFAIAATDSNYNYVHRLNKANLTWAGYPGETPVFNFASVPTNLRVCGFHVMAAGIVIRGFEVTATPVGTQKQSECFRIEGNGTSCDFFDCVAHDNAANGFYFVSGSTGSCTRCDSYNNIGPTADNVGNTDGFGAHANGVVFRYCRAWRCSDDGYDCLTSAGANTFDHCWAYNMTAGGDSNGFKIGGYATGNVPTTIPVHTVLYCLSANNGAHGFYANHQPGQAATWTHNTAYNNAAGNFDMLERTLQPVPTDPGTAANDIPGFREVLHFNIAYVRALTVDDATSAANSTNNSWTLPGVTAQASDFQSVDATQMTLPRAQGLMPFIAFMHLTAGSPLTGLGCFDPAPPAPAGLAAAWVANGRIDLSWGAVPGATSYNVKRATVSGGPYLVVASRITGASYSDTGVPAGTSFYYVVTAMNDIAFDDSAGSPEAAAIQGPVASVTGISPDTGASASDGITNTPGLVISGTAADSTGALGAGSTVTVSKAGTGVIGLVTADGSGHWSLDYSGTALAAGAHAFTANAANGGYPGLESPAFTIFIDTATPPAPVISSASGSPLVFTGTAEAGSTVALTRVGTGVIGTVIADGTGHWTLGTSLILGTETVSFFAASTDTAGNTSPASSTLSIDSSISVPVITAVSGDNGISASDRLTNDPTLVISGTAPANSTVTVIRRDLGEVGSTTADGGGSWNFDYTGTALASGPYLFNATATLNGSTSLYSADFTVTVDTVAPAVVSVVRQSPAFATITPSVSGVTYRVTFAKTVYGVANASFALNTAGGAAGAITGVSVVSGTVYDVTVGSLSGFGTLQLEPAAGNGVSDAAGNTVAAGFPAGQVYTRAAVSTGNGVWTNATSGGIWSTEANWQDLVIADGDANTANFSTLNLTADNTVKLDAARTLNALTFGDTTTSSAGGWIIDNNGNSANTITLAGPTPTITVGALGTGKTTAFNTSLAGSAGLTKAGTGTLVLNQPNAVTGALNVSAGTLSLGAAATLAPTAASTIGPASVLTVAGGSFSTGSLATMTTNASGAPTLNVSAGTATFSGGIALTSTGSDGGIIRVTGGTLTVADINIARNVAGTVAYTAGLVLSGGTTNIGTMELGTGNSNGTASVEGGVLNATGPITVGNQVTASRGGAIRVTSGTFNLTDTAAGLILSKVNGTNATNAAIALFSGGTSTIGRISLGFDNTVNAGTGTVTFSGGTVYLGSGGIVKNATPGMTSTITLSAGTLGAAANWTTAQPIAISGAATIKTADAANAPFDINLAGVLSGTGALTKSGGGTLTLGGANTRTGITTISAGTVSVASLTNGGSNSGLGAAALAATNLVLNGGSLQYTGPAVSQNRLFSLGASGGTLDASGTGALVFNSTTALTIVGTGNRTLTLTGTSTDVNTLRPALANPSSGTTAVAKTGVGSWTLTGPHTFTGGIAIDGGTLSIDGSVAAGATVEVNANGTLAGTGTVSKAINLNSGGVIAPAGIVSGTLTGASLTWNGGGKFAADLGATSDRLTLTGALAKGTAGTYGFVLGGTPAIGSVHTLASFASTTFSAADFSASGVTGTFSISGNSLLFTVAAPPAAAFNAWAAGLPAGQQGGAADPDGDGLPNLLEFVVGSDGGIANPDGSSVSVVTDAGVEYPAITYTRRIDRGGVTVSVLVSTTLDFSSPLGAVEISATPAAPGLETVVTRSAVPLATQARQFFRLSASLP